MIQKTFIVLLYLIAGNTCTGQEQDITTKLYDTYDQYKESALDKRRIKHKEVQQLVAEYKNNPKFKVQQVGKSIEGRNLSLISIGTGETDVFLWSQMHGDEPTATQAIFDIFNFLDSGDFAAEKEAILRNLTLHFLPMLNPDGAEVYQRRNTLGIDINRDALRLQSPEGRTLKRVRDSLKADFGFNLHDQSTYYNAERTEKPATISYLAPPFNYEKEINESRGNAMKVIVFMNNIIQKYAPGQVGRYSDDFEPRAFGDNIQKWGTSTILIESGGYANDIEKQEIRKLNYVSVLSAIHTIAKGNYVDIPIADYEKIPKNDRKLYDLKITGLSYELLGGDYVLDIGIQRPEVDDETHNSFYYSSRVIDQGDLSTYYGYETLEASGYSLRQGTVYPETVSNVEEVDFISMLRAGHTFLRVKNLSDKAVSSPQPFHLISEAYELPEFRLKPGINPTFLLEKEGEVRYAVINGFLIDLKMDRKSMVSQWEDQQGNAMIYR